MCVCVCSEIYKQGPMSMNNNTKKRKPMEELQRKAQKLQTLERFSNLKVENRVVSGASMDDKFSERRFIKLENVTNDVISSLSNVFAGSSSIFSSSRGDANLETKKWGTVAVSLEKSRPFTTANGEHFSTISFGNLDKSELSCSSNYA